MLPRFDEDVLMTNRSAGVTVIAILVLLGSIGTLGMSLLMCIGILVESASQTHEMPELIRTMFVLLSIVYGLMAIWGVFSGIGLIRLKNWARISVIVFSILLILLGGFG